MSAVYQGLILPNSNVNTDYIKEQPIAQRLDLVAAGFFHLLQRSGGHITGIKSYSMTYDIAHFDSLLTAQYIPIVWFKDAIDLLTDLIRFAYTGRKPHVNFIPAGTTPDEQYLAMYQVYSTGVALSKDFGTHHQEFTEFLVSTTGGKRNYDNLKVSLTQDKEWRLSRSYRKRVDENLALYERMKMFRVEFEKLKVLFHQMPYQAQLVRENEILLDKKYYTNSRSAPGGMRIIRYPGLPPSQWYTLNELIEQKFNMYVDVERLGGSRDYVDIRYDN